MVTYHTTSMPEDVDIVRFLDLAGCDLFRYVNNELQFCGFNHDLCKLSEQFVLGLRWFGIIFEAWLTVECVER